MMMMMMMMMTALVWIPVLSVCHWGTRALCSALFFFLSLLRFLGRRRRRSLLWLGLRLVNLFDDFLVQTGSLGLDEMMG